MGYRLITAPAELPLTVLEAKAHLKETSDERDAEILALIHAATDHAENYTGLRMVDQTWEMVLDEFPSAFGLLKPLLSVTSVKYLDVNDQEQTLPSTEYQVDLVNGWVVPAPGTSWPDTSDKINSVVVRFTCGYGGAAKVPYALQASMLLHVEAHYDRDERMMDKLLESADRLLFPYRIWKR
jgi:uncharacterized phiE125 gp8 family phage protein